MENEQYNPELDKNKIMRKAIERRVISQEMYNYAQKEYSSNEMVGKIRKIIEEEVNKC